MTHAIFFSAWKAVYTSVMNISKLKFWLELDNIYNLKTNYFSDRKQDTVPYINVYHNNSFLGCGDGSVVGKMALWLRGLAVGPEVPSSILNYYMVVHSHPN